MHNFVLPLAKIRGSTGPCNTLNAADEIFLDGSIRTMCTSICFTTWTSYDLKLDFVWTTQFIADLHRKNVFIKGACLYMYSYIVRKSLLQCTNQKLKFDLLLKFKKRTQSSVLPVYNLVANKALTCTCYYRGWLRLFIIIRY